MPTYEFRCPDGQIVERIFKMSDVPDEIPSPNGEGMATRIISRGGGLLFKGTGFYITDYGKDGKKDQRAASESASAPEKTSNDTSAKPSETKTDSKTDSKAAAKPDAGGSPKAESKPASTAVPGPSSSSSTKED